MYAVTVLDVSLAKKDISYLHTYSFALFGQVQKFADKDIDKYPKIVGIEVFGRGSCAEEKVEKLEN